MKRRHQSFRGEIGSLLYRIIYIGLVLLGITFFGLSIFDDIILVILGAITFALVGFILRWVGFWKY